MTEPQNRYFLWLDEERMMEIDSDDGGSGNGEGARPFDGAVVWVEGEGPLRDTLGKLVEVLLAEAVARRSSEIIVEVGEDCCPVHFVRGSEQLEMDALPVWLFGPFKDRIVRMCGKDIDENNGTVTITLKKSETSVKSDTEVQVSVAFGESSLRLIFAEIKR
jgi:hypothetical protein